VHWQATLRLVGGTGLGEVLVQLKREFADAKFRSRAHDWRIVNAGAGRVAHKASEQGGRGL
jgi:hypothetical protein